VKIPLHRHRFSRFTALVLSFLLVRQPVSFTQVNDDSQLSTHSQKIFSNGRIVELRDTNRFRLDTHGTIKLIGVITPSLNDAEVNRTIAGVVNKSDEAVSEQAPFTKSVVAMLVGKQIDVPGMTHILTSRDPVFRPSENLDAQGNLMVYVVLPQFKYHMIKYGDYTPTTLSTLGNDSEVLVGAEGLMLNASLVRAGFGIVDETVNFSEKGRFVELQKEAKEHKRGLWK
jgi:hypothetical protein